MLNEKSSFRMDDERWMKVKSNMKKVLRWDMEWDEVWAASFDKEMSE